MTTGSIPPYRTFSILIPCYNEARLVNTVLERIVAAPLHYPLVKELVLVDDGSSDGSGDIARQFGERHPEILFRYFRFDRNQGKGAAISKALELCSGEIALVQDADLEYDPADYNSLLKPVMEGHADVVYGSRFIGAGPHRVLFFFHTIGNKLFTFLSNVFTGLNLTDMETGYKLFVTEHLRSLRLYEKRFGFEPEVTAKISRIPRIRIYETGVAYYGRTYAEGKKINWKDGMHAIFCIFKYNVFSRK